MKPVWFGLIFLLNYVGCDLDLSRSSAGFFPGPKKAWSDTSLDKLRRDLFMNYDKYARPEEHFSPTELHFGVALLALEVEELKSQLVLHIWMRMVWNDGKLKWNESDYDGVDVARIADHEVWLPDIYVHNTPTGAESLVHFGHPNVLLYPNGEVLYVPPIKVAPVCELNLKYWPFDVQHCELVFSSWSHNGNEIIPKWYHDYNYIDMSDFRNVTTWNITNSTGAIVTKFFDCCAEPYHFIQYNLTLERAVGSYQAIVVTPAVAMLILAQFWLPPHAEERLFLNCCLIITEVMFLAYFTHHICAGAEAPLIVRFYSDSLLMVCLSTVGNVLIRRVFHPNLPWAIKRHLQGKLKKLLLLDWKFVEIHPDGTGVQGDDDFTCTCAEIYHVKAAREDAGDGLKVFLMFDRVMFLVYCLALSLLLVECY